MKKLLSLLMSLLICFALLPGQARAGDLPEAGEPPVQEEILGTEAPDEPEPPATPDWSDGIPDIDNDPHGKGGV